MYAFRMQFLSLDRTLRIFDTRQQYQELPLLSGDDEDDHGQATTHSELILCSGNSHSPNLALRHKKSNLQASSASYNAYFKPFGPP